jgi:formylglycine-generating enzyme required for sulfatase activity
MSRIVVLASGVLAFGLALQLAVAAPAAAQQPLAPERERALAAGESFRECDGCPEMVAVPAGSFTMGSPANEGGRNTWEGPQHLVTIPRPFAVGKFEVTVDQFSAFVRETSYVEATRCWTYENGTFDERLGRSWRRPGFPQEGDHPAACLSFEDATAYADWLRRKIGKTYRLLSEAEWEYAARGRTAPGPAPRFPFGDDEAAMCANANGLDQTARAAIRVSGGAWNFLPCSDGYVFTAPIGKFAPNAFGLHDMIGNVKEWTQDCFHPGKGYEGAPVDGSAWTSLGACSLRVVRGGSWLSYARLLRVAFRFRNGPTDYANDVGLRVARTLAGP